MRDDFRWHCCDCGESFEVANKDYCDGGYLGEPHYTCPYCGSDELEEMYQCSLCGEWFVGEELHGYMGEMVCEGCIAEHTDVDTVLAFSRSDNLTEIALPSIIADHFSEDEIIDVLYEWFKRNHTESEQLDLCKEMVECDKTGFADFLVTEGE